MTASLRDLKECANRQVFLGQIVYVSHQDWGSFLGALCTVEETQEEVERWLEISNQGLAVVWSENRPILINASLNELSTKLINALETERDYMREEMAKKLSEMADRIANLKAITHQPEPEPEPEPEFKGSPKLTFVRAAIKALAAVLPLAPDNPIIYYDEEGEESFHARPESLFMDLWACDYESIQFDLIGGKTVYLNLVWDNDTPEVIADFSWTRGDEELQQLVANTLSNTAKEFGYD